MEKIAAAENAASRQRREAMSKQLKPPTSPTRRIRAACCLRVEQFFLQHPWGIPAAVSAIRLQFDSHIYTHAMLCCGDLRLLAPWSCGRAPSGTTTTSVFSDSWFAAVCVSWQTFYITLCISHDVKRLFFTDAPHDLRHVSPLSSLKHRLRIYHRPDSRRLLEGS